MRKVFDEVRGTWFSATPEELVRQMWVRRLVEVFKFPRELIAVEKELQAVTHWKHVPMRRIDILCFQKVGSALKPYLLMECKQGELTDDAFAQVAGYNAYVEAPYLAVVNMQEARVMHEGKLCDTLPTYEARHG